MCHSYIMMPIFRGCITYIPLSPSLPIPSIAMFSLVGDPYPNLHLLSPWLDHQLVWFSEKHSCLFLRAAIDKHHWTCSLNFHSALSEYWKYSVCPSQVNYILTYTQIYTYIRYCDSVRYVHISPL